MKASKKRILKDGSKFDHLFPVPNYTETEVSKGIDVQETIAHMIQMSKKWQLDTAKLAPHLKGATLKETCQNVWHFVYDHIQYNLDKIGFEELRRPAYLWATRKHGGDCDCMAIFIATILMNLGHGNRTYFRVTKYSKEWQHVYVIVKDNDKNIVIDCVLDEFNKEVPFSGNIDTNVSLMPTTLLEGFGDLEYDQDLGILKRKKPSGKAAANQDWEAKVKAFIAGTGALSKAEFDQIKAQAPSVYVKYRAQLDAKFGAQKLTRKQERQLRTKANKDNRQTKRDAKRQIRAGGGTKQDKKEALKKIRENAKAIKKDVKSTKTNPLNKLRTRIQEKKITKKGGNLSEMQQLEEKIKLGTATEADAKLIRLKYRPLFLKYKKQLNALLKPKTVTDVKQTEVKKELEKGKDITEATEIAEDTNIVPEPEPTETEPEPEPQPQKLPSRTSPKATADQVRNTAIRFSQKENITEQPDANNESESALPEVMQQIQNTALKFSKKENITAKDEADTIDVNAKDVTDGDGDSGGENKAMDWIKENKILVGVGAAVLVGGIAFATMSGGKKSVSGLSGTGKRKKTKNRKNKVYTTR